MKTKNIYEKYSLEEVADSIVFKNPLSEKEEKESSAELAEVRRKNRESLTDNQKLYAKVLQLRFLMEDYAKSEVYDENRSFASFLKTYIKFSYKVQKKFAEDINLKQTELSLILNEHRLPNEKTIVRLEIHSDNVIPALSWYRVVEKQREYELEQDIKFKQEQKKFVKNHLEFGNAV
ncbi:hypothetical protein EV143_1174 [Flavobacterium chryseum]|uniref:hypothetical protein n=1 Tax=Flavobacterium sp. P3160 TaxID=2512113 RepID=UPI00105C7A9C|nr:hypothetical protein [Flavobacterium sp. P3160]TDO68861.1 hypothetical protein EV143_1174 [Flavobacterium sp. P3160]